MTIFDLLFFAFEYLFQILNKTFCFVCNVIGISPNRKPSLLLMVVALPLGLLASLTFVVILIPLVILYVFAVIWNFLALGLISVFIANPEIRNDGIHLTSRVGITSRLIKWKEIRTVRNVPNLPFSFQEITMISGERLEIYLSRDDLFESFLSQYDIPYIIEM
jgi:hypothetical protein